MIFLKALSTWEQHRVLPICVVHHHRPFSSWYAQLQMLIGNCSRNGRTASTLVSPRILMGLPFDGDTRRRGRANFFESLRSTHLLSRILMNQIECCVRIHRHRSRRAFLWRSNNYFFRFSTFLLLWKIKNQLRSRRGRGRIHYLPSHRRVGLHWLHCSVVTLRSSISQIEWWPLWFI